MKVLFQCVIFGLGRYSRGKSWTPLHYFSHSLSCLESLILRVRDSLNHGVVEVESASGDCLVQSYPSAHRGESFSRLSLDQVAQEDVQLGFEHLHECRLHSFFKQLLCVQSSSQ